MKIDLRFQKYKNLLFRNKKIKHLYYNINRIHIIGAFFMLCFLIVISKLATYTVGDYDFYKTLADKQQIGKVVVPVTRGTIYSSTQEGTILGTSLNLYNVAIDPMIAGNKEKLVSFLEELVYLQICDGKTQGICQNNLSKFLKVLEIENFEYSEENVRAKIKEKLTKKVYQTKVESVLLPKEFDEADIEQIKNLGIKGIYPRNTYVYVNPEEISDNLAIAKRLSPIMGMNEDTLAHLFRKRALRYVPILNKTSIRVYEYLKEYIDDEKQAYKKGLVDEDNLVFPFVILETQPNRFYPESTVASQVIGFVDSSGAGNYGIEGKFNDVLKGNNGQIISRRDIKGRTINPIELNKEDLNTKGASIKTTIDRNIQKKIENILEKGVKKYRANKGTIVVMNPKTSEIIAMANYPTYDINNYGDVYELEKVKYSRYPDPKIDLLGYPVFVEDSELGKKFIYDNKELLLRKATREELGDVALVKYKYKNDFGAGVYQNDAISALYEPGSIMKAMTVAIGIDSGEINKNSTYIDKGSVKIDQFEIKNVSDKCLGYHTFGHALNYSCNVGMIRIVQKVGKQLVSNYFHEFGFSEITGIDLFGEVYSEIEPWENWSKAKLLTNSFGLGISVTPLQMANAYNVIANGGIYMKPKIIEEVLYPNGKRVVYKTESQRRVITKETSAIMSDMLASSIRDGVAKNADVPGYALAGKTGTAEIPYKGKYESGPGFTNASFAGFGPIEDPRFTIVIKLERPRTTQYGGASSAFLFKEAAQYLLDYYEIPRRKEEKK